MNQHSAVHFIIASGDDVFGGIRTEPSWLSVQVVQKYDPAPKQPFQFLPIVRQEECFLFHCYGFFKIYYYLCGS